MKEFPSNWAALFSEAFHKAVHNGIECADRGKTVIHSRVTPLYKELKIKTLRLMDCQRKKH